MMPESPPSRDDVLRRALVSTADLTPYAPRKPNRRIAIGFIVAFGLAGALAGCAVAAAAVIAPPSAASTFDVSFAARSAAQAHDAKLTGTPIVRSAAGELVLNLGPRPSDATSLLVGFECLDPGAYTTTVNGKLAAAQTCFRPSATRAGGVTKNAPIGPGESYVVRSDTGVANGQVLTISREAGQRLTIDSPKGGRFIVWVSWLVVPKFGPSATELAELADGKVTRAEYIAAFNRFSGCMTAGGYPLRNVSESGATVDYSFPEEAPLAGVLGRCAATEFNAVDHIWETHGGASR